MASSPTPTEGKAAIGKKKRAPATKNPSYQVPSMARAFFVYAVVPLALLAFVGFYGRHYGDPTYAHPMSTVTEENGFVKIKKGGKMEDAPGRKKKQGSATSRPDEARQSRKRTSQGSSRRQGADFEKRKQFDEYIERIRKDHKNDPEDHFKALSLADALRSRDLTFHDGGSSQAEGIQTYQHVLTLLYQTRSDLLAKNEPTNIPPGTSEPSGDEMSLDYRSKSIDGLICSVQNNLGKLFFMANMFEKAVEAHDACLELMGNDLDALSHQGSTYIILGQYKQAAENYSKVLKLDTNRLFTDVYTGMSKVLVAEEEAVDGGWDVLVNHLQKEIPIQTATLEATDNIHAKKYMYDNMKKMHLAMFSYHDTKTKNTTEAWDNLSLAYQYKMSALPKWNYGTERQRVEVIRKIFHQNFWPVGVGSKSKTPIFIIGFVRSGSTLLERVLDAHSSIVGTGEDSVFNGRLDKIRDAIVDASITSDHNMVKRVVNDLADEVVDGMRERWEKIEALSLKSGKSNPKRFADKMLVNYMNVGFIHMLFPKALILHMAREPMDTLFSAFKHDFPPGTLSYTNEFTSLAELYHSYRDIMEHWDQVLPGRVTHVRYEDMVRDMPAMAKAIIKATGLPWEEEVLDFHKKKHAVNTLSTSQVRKGVYSHHLKSWKRYEEYLQPLVELIGERADYDLKTSMKGYQTPEERILNEEE